jgi:hypothetical protein
VEAPAKASPAFTLPELIVGIVLLAFILFMSIGVLLAGKRLLPGRSIQAGEETLALAPSPGVFADAVAFHAQLIERLSSARAVYVFGGTHRGLPAAASRLGDRALQTQVLPVLGDVRTGLPLDSHAFFDRYSSALGARESGGNMADFSVLIIGELNGRVGATALVQVRSRPLPDDNTSFIRREAVLYDSSGGAWRYVFAERADAASIAAVGATHFWYRFEEGRVAEEAPVLATFPDPWLYANSGAIENGTQSPAFSRFVYLLPVSS